ncbi:hypothetical protein DNTS_008851 [Danionella cerebrum]|uniref:Palmitoyltransferase n=1 Tax=Danionella cerebrum TaxID=2873325 RepID=A0A553RGC3_9TELE|nr:hypothetical protein DNTS_008851 [Danionella translucida]
MTKLNCFSLQRSRTAPLDSSSSRNDLFSPPLHSRINGWSAPLHCFQVIAWASFSFMATVGFGIYVPLLPAPWRDVAYGLLSLTFTVHLLFHLAAVTIDPADMSVRLKKDYSSPMPVFDSTKHTHVIHNLHCSLCEVDVSLKAKHCSSCNKCIADFDHHCKWLNNCVGGRNYWAFITAVSSAVFGLIVLIVVMLFVFIERFVNPAILRTAPQFQTVKGNGTWLVFLPAAAVESSSTSLLVLALVSVLLSLAALLLLGHLLCFHTYLLLHGISTYEFITKKCRSLNPKDNKQTPPVPPSIRAISQSIQPLESLVNCDALLPSRSCSSIFKLEDRRETSSQMPEPICAELGEASGEHHQDFSESTQIIPGENYLFIYLFFIEVCVCVLMFVYQIIHK